jgi:hypothetical protein
VDGPPTDRPRRPTLADLPHQRPGCLCGACQAWALHADDEAVAPYRLRAMLYRSLARRGVVSAAEAARERRRMKEHEAMVTAAAQAAGTLGSADPRRLAADFGAALDGIADRC